MSTLQEKYDAQTRGDGIGGTDGGAPTVDASARKPIYRALITHAEILAHKLFDPELIGSSARFTALLQAKGIPEVYLLDGAPFRASETNDGLLVEFE